MQEGDKQKQLLDHEIRGMISVLIRRLADLQYVHKPFGSAGGSSSSSCSGAPPRNKSDHHDAQQADHDFRMITLSGSNVGATLRGGGEMQDLDESWKNNDYDETDDESMTAFVNSNFQAINNSLMLGGSYSTNDPGVHLEVADDYDSTLPHHATVHQKRTAKKKKTNQTDGNQTDGNNDFGN